MKLRCSKKTCAALVAFLILAVPAVACSQKGGTQQSGSTVQAGSGSSSRTVIVGKVNAVVGNQVTLAVGSLNRNENGAESASSAAASSGSASSSPSSSLITLTGETKTVLIPAGLTLSNGFTAGNRTSSQRSGSSGSASGGSDGEITKGGSGQQPSDGQTGGGGTTSRSGTATRTSGSGGTAGATAGAGTLMQRSNDFSSIATGMILQIVEETLSDGTQGIVSVLVLSR